MSYRKLHIHPLHSLLRSSLARTLVGALGAAAPLAVMANPTGGQVVGGTATIGSVGANGLVINQGSQKAIINWQQFSVGSGEYVQFVQPNSSAVVLNRVIGSNPSSIFGNITANGQVFLVNPNGVYFAPAASLDVQGLVASTLDLNDADFMAGRYLFNKAPGAPDAGVVNGGSIHAGPGGYVVLAGDYAQNSGTIVAQTGRVYLAAGNAATLTFDQNQLISYVVDGKTLSRLAGVTNTGEIAADGGAVVMTADVANALTATAVNNSGLITAHSAVNQGGTIVLLAQGGGIENSGTLDAGARQSGVVGGTVIIRGDGHTQLDPTSVVDASGAGAKGGFVELSGHTLQVGGQVNEGHGGTLLIDPAKLFITNGASSGGVITSGDYVGSQFIDNQLNLNNNVVLVASNSIKAFNPSAPGATGPATAITALTGTGNLTIKTGTFGATIGGTLGGAHCGSGVCAPGGSRVFNPGSGTINLTGVTINIRGAFTANAQQGTVNLGAVTAKTIVITGGKITLSGNVTASVGNLAITAARGAPSAASVTATGTVLTGKAVTIQASGSKGGKITTGGIIATSGSVTLQAQKTAGAGTGAASINAGNLTATKGKISVVEIGSTGKITLGSLHAASSGISLKASDTATVAAGSITMGNAAAKTMQAATHVSKGGNITATGTLNATGLFASGSNAGMGIVLNANATGLQHSGAKVKVTGAVSANAGGVRINTTFFTGTSGGVGGSVSAQGITAKTIDIETHEGSVHLSNGGNIKINGNLVATGSATNAGVILIGEKGGGFGEGNIKVTGSVTASHGIVNIADQAKHDLTAPAVAGITVGTVTASKINLSISAGTASGSAGIQAGNLKTTSGAGHDITLSINNTRKDKMSIAGSISAGGNLTINEHGHYRQSNLTVSGPIKAGGNVKIQQGGGSGSAAMATTLGNVTAGGSASLGFSHAGAGNVNVTLGNIAAKGVKISTNHGGNLAFGSVSAGAGSVNISAVGNTGQVRITQGVTQTIKAGLAVNLNDSATGVTGASMAQINVGNVIAGGNVTLHAGQSNTTLNSAAVIAGNVTGKSVVFHVDGGPISKLNVGNVSATGSAGVSFMVQNFSRKLSVKTGTLNAAVKIHGFASGSGAVTFGAITAPKISFNASGKGDTIVTGALTAVSTAGAASIGLNAAAGASNGGVTVNGNVTVTGKTPAHPTAGQNGLPLAASLALSGNASGGHVVAIHVNGAINVTGNAGSFSVARSIGETSGMATLTTKGKGGAAAISLNAGGGQGSVSVTGGLTAKGADGNVVVAANKITLGNVTVTGSGHTISRKLASAGSVNTFSSNNSAGQALLALVGAASSNPSAPPVVATSIKVGNIHLNGKGLALAFVEGTNVSAGSILATATVATGTRHIKGIKPHTTCLHACSQSSSGGVFRDFEGDALGSGHITGGRAVVAIGTGGSSSSKSAPAKSIKVGNVSVTGVGAADIGLFGSTVQTGNLSAIATKGSEQGVGSTHQLNSHGTASTGLFKRSFKGTGGQAGIHLGGGAGGVTVVGNVTVTGPTARGKIQGAAVSVSGGITAAASGGGSVSTDTVFTPKTGTGFHTHFTGPGRDNGLTMQATGAVNVGGLLKITGPGITGALIDGGKVTLGGLSGSDSGPGHYSILDTRVSPTATSFTASSLGFVITDATTVAGATVFAPAAVNGNVTLKAKGGIYLPDELAATGTFSAKAGGNIVGNGNGFILHIKEISNVAGHHGGSHSTSTGVTSTSVPHLHLSAQAATFSAGGSIDVTGGQLTIGNGAAPGVTGDTVLLADLAAKGLSPATQVPSGYFKAGTTLALGAITMSGDFLYLQGNAVAISGAVSVPAKSLVQVSPFSATLPIDIEDTTLLSKTGRFTFVNAARTANTSAFFGLTNQGFLSLFPGDTLVVGNSAEQAAVTIGANGKISLIGGTSLIIYSTGAVAGLGNVITTGTVLSLETVLAPTPIPAPVQTPAPPPTPSEIDPNSSNNNNAADKKQQGEDTGTGQQGGTVSHSGDTGGACH